MILTNKIAFGRQHVCLRCEEAFQSTENEIYCERCREIIRKQEINDMPQAEENTIKLQIELICKNS